MPADAGTPIPGRPRLPASRDLAHTGEDHGLSWEGWSLHPGVPLGCRGLYVPDDVRVRVPDLEWVPCSGMKGCERVEVTWGVHPYMDRAFWIGGSEPEFLYLYRILAQGVFESDVYRLPGTPMAAMRSDRSEQPVLVLHPLAPTGDERSAMFSAIAEFCSSAREELTYVAPASDLGSLLSAREPTVTWTRAYLGNNYTCCFDPDNASSEVVAPGLSPGVGVGEVGTGALHHVVPPDAGGEWHTDAVVGSDVFVARFSRGITEIWVSKGLGAVRPFLSVQGGSVKGFATDGQTMVWGEASDPAGSSPLDGYRRYEIFASPYTADPERLERQSAGRMSPSVVFGDMVLRAGYAVGGNLSDRQFVLRLSDRRWFRLDLPRDWRIFSWVVPARSGLYFTLFDGTPAPITLARVDWSVLTPYEYSP